MQYCLSITDCWPIHVIIVSLKDKSFFIVNIVVSLWLLSLFFWNGRLCWPFLKDPKRIHPNENNTEQYRTHGREKNFSWRKTAYCVRIIDSLLASMHHYFGKSSMKTNNDKIDFSRETWFSTNNVLIKINCIILK